MKLENKVAIVTGAAKGMGAAISLTLAREGADLVLAAREAAPLEEVATKARGIGRRAEVVPVDVTVEPQVVAMVERTLAAFDGRIDILVNVAGVTGPIETPVWKIEQADFDHVIAVNLRGTYLPIKHVLPTMIAQRSGKIVNIGGTSGLRGYKYRTAYSSSKWAVRGLTRTVALDVGEYGINVNVVCPGIVETPRMERLCDEKARARGRTFDQVYQEYVDEMALKRVTTPQDVA
ncbi:MAG: SDR family NAD(P)-dependent oxidoreductase, partial [Alphaproteobacteria bacterium]